MSYKLKDVNVRISVIWNFEAPAGAGDTHYSLMRGTKANVIIRQGKEENYRPELFVESASGANAATLEAALRNRLAALENQYPGLELKSDGKQWHILIPAQHRKDHEAHFGQVLESFLRYLRAGKLPSWEVPNMITKYYTTRRRWSLHLVALLQRVRKHLRDACEMDQETATKTKVLTFFGPEGTQRL